MTTRPCLPPSTGKNPKRYGLAFEHLNLRRNPFEELSPDTRAQLAIVDIEPYLDFLKQKRAALVFIGHCGRGKTTHLLALKRQFPEAPYVYFPEDGPRPRIPKAPRLFVDETQRMSWWQRIRLFSGSSTLILGTHRNEDTALERAKRPVLRVEIKTLSLEKLRQIVLSRLEWSRRSSGPIPTLADFELESLLQHFRDNIRALEYSLYEVFQRLQENGPVSLDPSTFPSLESFEEVAHD